MVLFVFCRGLNERQNPSVAKDVPPVKRMPGWLAIPFLIAVALMASPAALADDELQDYQQQCDLAIGAENTVREFNCDDGANVPEQGSAPYKTGATCNEPNRLNKECDPGSTFQVLKRTDDAYVVANCRKEGQPDGFGDIAVIQYNRKNGATCFYQALAGPGAPLPSQMQAPSKGLSTSSLWLTPSATAEIGCGGCHDNGPFIRSPYLNQIPKPTKIGEPDNTIPGKDSETFNRDQLYAFVGKDFAAWKAFKVEIKDNLCTSCHRLGVSNITVPRYPCGPHHCGTARDFAERATRADEKSDADSRDAHKTYPPSPYSPMWMPPHCGDSYQTCNSFNPAHKDFADAIHDCAIRWRENKPLPNEPTCSITQLAPKPITPISIKLMPIYNYLLNDLTDLTQIYYYLLND